jgi:hypothetical protein
MRRIHSIKIKKILDDEKIQQKIKNKISRKKESNKKSYEKTKNPGRRDGEETLLVRQRIERIRERILTK